MTCSGSCAAWKHATAPAYRYVVLPFVRGEARKDSRPDIREAFENLAAAGPIIAPPQSVGSLSPYEIHPVVATAGRSQAGEQFRKRVDAHLADYLSTLALFARQREATEGSGWSSWTPRCAPSHT